MDNCLHKLLKCYWGYDSFRPLQEEIICSVMQGHDTMALLPTGGGKSLCYQLPGLAMEGLCLVVSPLIALMKDQVQQLNDRHIKSACIVSGMGVNEVTAVLNNAVCGVIKFLYVSPERLKQRSFIEHFRRMKVCLIAVDEAHCVSQWGYDFRPPYLQIAEIRDYHPKAPLVALTATATPEVVSDVCRQLKMRDVCHFQSSFVRPNISYMVLHDADKMQRLLRITQKVKGSGIVYTRSRRSTQTIAHFLDKSGISAIFYHAGLEASERDRRQAIWMNNECRIMVATNAFGMGIDKPDVRFVVHVDMPNSVEAYFQEAGRAGRDGNAAYAVLIFDDSDPTRLRLNINADFPKLQQIRNVYRAICNHYRLPVGGGIDSRFDFDLETICSSYNFQVREFYAACKILEREGLIAIPEREESYSTLYIPIARDELYRFHVDHQRFGDLLQTLMRMYPGLLDSPVPVNERKIANKCSADVQQVSAMLVQLNEMHIVEYRPCPQGPQILFPTERIDEHSIYPTEQNYSLLKQSAEQRLNAIIHYAENEEVCRSRLLVAYFGEKEGDDCGVCDVCRRRQNWQKGAEEVILDLLGKNAMTLDSLTMLLREKGYTDVVETIREMLDRGELNFNGTTLAVDSRTIGRQEAP